MHSGPYSRKPARLFGEALLSNFAKNHVFTESVRLIGENPGVFYSGCISGGGGVDKLGFMDP